MEKKSLVSLKAECFQANKNKNGSSITFAIGVQQTDKGPAARTTVTFQLPDQTAADGFVIGKSYNISVTE
jgi:hypothetical protein